MAALACQTLNGREQPLPAPTGNGELRSAGLPKQVQSGQEEALATKLAEEMRELWRQGQRPVAEDFLQTHPEISCHSQAAVRLIYEEVCLREEYGLQVTSIEVVRRFPQWQAELKFLLDCHGVLQPIMARPIFPNVEETWNDYQLLAELGRGTFGRVFLAKQLSLADRPLVLKMTALDEGEHLSLARLQHTYIMPLYAVQDDPGRHLRALCMPYFGGTTLRQILDALADKPVGQRTGEDLLLVLDRVQAAAPVSFSRKGPARQLLARASYVQAMCWIGSCLAEALQYAHERGLVHLDLKPHNILLASDGQPMLLDFNLARQAIQPGVVTVDSFGGTPEYMSPEQGLALEQIRAKLPIRIPVDGRSDVYSLGLVLYEALGGPFPLPSKTSPPCLEMCNSTVSPALADVIHKCLAYDAGDRYADAGALASDLRRQLADLPLRGVRNRNLRERWRKWRRRRPHSLAQAGMVLTLLLAAVVAMLYAGRSIYHQRRDAEAALADGQAQFQSHAYAEAAFTLKRGIMVAEGLAGPDGLRQQLARHLQRAERAQAAHLLHVSSERMRFLFGIEPFDFRRGSMLQTQCQKIWDMRNLFRQHDGCELEPAVEEQIQHDLFDLVVLWADLCVRLATGGQVDKARQDRLRLLNEATSFFIEKEDCRWLLALADAGHGIEGIPDTAWGHYSSGQFFLRAGNMARAMVEFERALELRPQDFWPSFYQGTCAYRLGRYADAVNAFRVCLALAPDSPECFSNHGLAEAALGHTERALQDYTRALQLDPTLAAAALNRGILHYQAKRYDEALTDLKSALDAGGGPGLVHYHIALVQLAKQDRSAALNSLRLVSENDPHYAEARQLYERLLRGR